MLTPDPEFEGKKLADRAKALMALRSATYAFPQQRLGQLLSNALHHTPWREDSFSMPDESLAGYLDEYTRGVKSTVREQGDAAEIARLRKVLQNIDVFARDGMNHVLVRVNTDAALAHIRMMALDALKAP